jgi:hypothetical protein
MTKKKETGTEVAVVETANVPAVVKSNLPAYLQGYQGRLGTENIEAGDVVIPRIKIGQAMTPGVKNGELEEGQLYLNLDDEVLAEAGEHLPIVVLSQSKEYILWRPREDNGGGILARARAVKVDGETRYAWDKPNTPFEVKVGGKVKVTWKTGEYIDEDGLSAYGSEIPGDPESGIAATAHHNYVVVMPTQFDALAALSLSKSQSKRAKKFNGLLKRQCETQNVPAWSLLYDIFSDDDKNTNGDQFKNFAFKSAGFVPEEKLAKYTELANNLARMNVVHDVGDDEQASSGPKAL